MLRRFPNLSPSHKRAEREQTEGIFDVTLPGDPRARRHYGGDPEGRAMFDRYYMVSPGDVPEVSRRLDTRGARSRQTSP